MGENAMLLLLWILQSAITWSLIPAEAAATQCPGASQQLRRIKHKMLSCGLGYRQLCHSERACLRGKEWRVIIAP